MDTYQTDLMKSSQKGIQNIHSDSFLALNVSQELKKIFYLAF